MLNAKITVLDAEGDRVLPAYYSDNYIALMPGEIRNIEVHCPPGGRQCERVALRGWDADIRNVAIERQP